MTYNETLAFLFQQLPMYQRIGRAAYKADLKNTEALMEILGHPEKGFKSVHVAGTNGKGSTSHLLASALQEVGYKVGLYTSPHLIDFRERIKINGNVIPEEDVTAFVEERKEAFEELDLSFFEWTVGLAFHHFAKSKVDLAVIETGLGGRLDSTNVLSPELSIITNISLDHTQFLGETKVLIAAEKAGIIKREIPVVIGESQTETNVVFEAKAEDVGTTIRWADQENPTPFKTELIGPFQKKNVQTASVALNILRERGWKIKDEHISTGFLKVVKNTGLRGRWEIIQQNPLVVCDVGHNTAAVPAIVDQIAEQGKDSLHLVLGFVSDKNVKDILRLFPRRAHYYLCQPSIPRAMPIDQLAEIAQSLNYRFESFKNTKAAYEAAIRKGGSHDFIFVGGSTFVVADLLSALS